jgi:hypothetical protein
MDMHNPSYRLAAGLALAAALALVWGSLGVGLIGADGDPINAVYFGVLAVGALGTLVARFRPLGMARALVAMAVAQALIGVLAIVAGWGLPYSPPLEIAGLTGGFVALFLASAWLFRRAALEHPDPGAA